MKRRDFIAMAVIYGCGQQNIKQDPFSGDVKPNNLSEQALPIINLLRSQYHLTPVKVNNACIHAAEAQSKNMSTTGVFYHIIDGIGELGQFKPRMKHFGVKLPAGENIAFGQRSLERVMEVWTNSPPHLKNMINPNYINFGVAQAVHANTGNKIYWTMVLSA